MRGLEASNIVIIMDDDRRSRRSGILSRTSSMPTLDEAVALALRFHQAGDLQQAESIYRQLLQADGSLAQVWCLLGAACHSQGRYAEAETCSRQALRLE